MRVRSLYPLSLLGGKWSFVSSALQVERRLRKVGIPSGSDVERNGRSIYSQAISRLRVPSGDIYDSLYIGDGLADCLMDFLV